MLEGGGRALTGGIVCIFKFAKIKVSVELVKGAQPAVLDTAVYLYQVYLDPGQKLPRP